MNTLKFSKGQHGYIIELLDPKGKEIWTQFCRYDVPENGRRRWAALCRKSATRLGSYKEIVESDLDL